MQYITEFHTGFYVGGRTSDPCMLQSMNNRTKEFFLILSFSEVDSNAILMSNCGPQNSAD